MRYLFILLSFFISCLTFSQEYKKDTLFFSYDKYYTICADEISDLTYSEQKKNNLLSKEKTKTNGNILFFKKKVYYNLKPKQIYSLKKYLEQRKFYYMGTHNEIVDNWKLKNYLLTKYISFLVKENTFIEIESMKYNSYYPFKKGVNTIHNPIKDTLFFSLDKKYIVKSIHNSNQYYIKNSGTHFEKIEVISNLKPNKILSIDKFLNSQEFFGKDYKRNLKGYSLTQYLNEYVIFLVKKNEFILVNSTYIIE